MQVWQTIRMSCAPLLLALSLLLFCTPVSASISAPSPQLSERQVTTHCPSHQANLNHASFDCLGHCALPAQITPSSCITPLLSVQHAAPAFSQQMVDLSPASPPPRRHS